MDERELNDIVNILDGMVAQDISRIKVATSDEAEEGSVSREYHHGRCDIGSPWARGCAFDVLEQPMEYNGEIIVDICRYGYTYYAAGLLQWMNLIQSCTTS